MRRYNPREIEPKWQKIWDETGTYTTDLNSGKPKYMAMSMFNYPSGAGIHIGHAMNYTISDVKARFKRQQGFESYHPVGWDAFGLPAENYAIKSGVSPQESMAKIIPMYHKQYKAMGWSNDWEKEIATHMPEYYKWTQWIFLKMHENGLAYQDERLQWWCPIDKTVLANEQVIDGKCWRHDGPDDPPAEKKEIKQWFFKITDYADELLEATDQLNWSESVKLAQKNWIGKSQGAEIDFKLKDSEASIKVFTTRPDTIFGATFLVLAPEHEILNKLSISDEAKEYIKVSEAKTELERQENKAKTGVRLEGIAAINPATQEDIPIFIADYVLPGYGTGAIMAVPAHDERDYEFAKKFDLPITQVITSYEVYDGIHAPKAELETIKRRSVDAIIRDSEGKVLLLVEDDHVHFVGGGIDGDETFEKALRREVKEETGYTDIASIRQVSPYVAGVAYRHTKNRNQQVYGAFYEVVLASKRQTSSEIDEGHHQVIWADEKDVADRITWKWHLDAWKNYLASGRENFYDGEGILINSGKFDWMPTSEAREKITAQFGQEKINYKMRDWSVSRQRYWGAPIPIINCPNCGAVPVAEADLPVILPELDDYEPAGDGRGALARAADWLKVPCPNCGGPAERETDTMDTYVDSGWYMYRYMDPHNQQEIFDKGIVKKWEPVDFYNGADHATAHLLYSRFIGHFFKKIGLVEEPEPFKQFLFNGKVTAQDGTMFSKSKGNGVDPLEIIDSGYGADALRMYLMFAAPLDLWVRWDPQGVPGTFRFLSRVWNLAEDYLASADVELSESERADINRCVHTMIKKMTHDLENNLYNTAIAAAMSCVNQLYKIKETKFGRNEVWQSALESLAACIAPFAPHVSEELWHGLGHSSTVHKDSWPKYEEKYLIQAQLKIAVQINGKVRAEILVDAGISEEAVIEAAKSDDKVAAYLEGKPIKKAIYVPGRLVSLVV